MWEGSFDQAFTNLTSSGSETVLFTLQTFCESCKSLLYNGVTDSGRQILDLYVGVRIPGGYPARTRTWKDRTKICNAEPLNALNTKDLQDSQKICCVKCTVSDPELDRLAGVWVDLPEHIRKTILTVAGLDS
jgi:hypothetical protein